MARTQLRRFVLFVASRSMLQLACSKWQDQEASGIVAIADETLGGMNSRTDGLECLDLM